MCAKLILVQYKTFLLELASTELVQTAFQTIYEHLQHEADGLGCLESCTILLCLLLMSVYCLQPSRLQFTYMVLKLSFHQTLLGTRMELS